MKIKPYVLFLMLMSLFCQEGMAQDSLVKRRVYLGLSVSSYYQKIFIDQSPYFALYMPQQLVPLRCGVDIKVKITPRFSVGAGLVADIQRQTANYLINKTVSPNEIAKMEQTVRTISIGLPLRADFRLTRGRVAPFVTGGWFSSMYVEQSMRTDVTWGDGHQTSDLVKVTRRKEDQQLLMLIQLGAGLDIELNRFKLQLFPLYEGGIDIFHQKVLGKTIYQHRIGGMLSVYYNL
jgi:hypothetical protein